MRIEDLRNSAWRFNERLNFVKNRGQVLTEEYEHVVKEIIQRVQKEGDKAIIEYTKRFDGLGSLLRLWKSLTRSLRGLITR